MMNRFQTLPSISTGAFKRCFQFQLAPSNVAFNFNLRRYTPVTKPSRARPRAL
jgi:hypothetical protein